MCPASYLVHDPNVIVGCLIKLQGLVNKVHDEAHKFQ